MHVGSASGFKDADCVYSESPSSLPVFRYHERKQYVPQFDVLAPYGQRAYAVDLCTHIAW